MLLVKGKCGSAEPWSILEVATGQAPDVLAIRLAKELKQIPETSAEVLVPFRRNANGEPEWVVEHVYVRGANGSIGKLANTAGIDFLRKETAEPPWIASLLAQEQADQRLVTPAVGTFVRVLTGPLARLCGNVEKSRNGTLTVAIQMRTKKVTLYTLPENLQSVHCPPEQRVFFYHSELFP